MPLRRYTSSPRMQFAGTSLGAWSFRDNGATLHFGSAGAWNLNFNVPMNLTIYGVSGGGSSQAQSGGIGSAGSGGGASNVVGIPIRVLPNYTYLLNVGGIAAGGAGGDTYLQIVGVQLFLHLGGGQPGLTAIGQPGGVGGLVYAGAGSIQGGNGGSSDPGNPDNTGFGGGWAGGTGGGGGGGLENVGNGHPSGAGGGPRGGVGMISGISRSGGSQPGIGDATVNAAISVTADDGGGGGGGTGVQIPGSSVYYGAGAGGAGGGATIPGIGKGGAFTFVFTGLGS